MTINYNRTGADRKPLVIAISAITGAEAKYLGAPTFAYQVDYFTIDRSGGVTFDDRADSEEVANLIELVAWGSKPGRLRAGTPPSRRRLLPPRITAD